MFFKELEAMWTVEDLSTLPLFIGDEPRLTRSSIKRGERMYPFWILSIDNDLTHFEEPIPKESDEIVNTPYMGSQAKRKSTTTIKYWFDRTVE